MNNVIFLSLSLVFKILRHRCKKSTTYTCFSYIIQWLNALRFSTSKINIVPFDNLHITQRTTFIHWKIYQISKNIFDKEQYFSMFCRKGKSEAKFFAFKKHNDSQRFARNSQAEMVPILQCEQGLKDHHSSWLRILSDSQIHVNALQTKNHMPAQSELVLVVQTSWNRNHPFSFQQICIWSSNFLPSANELAER